jgi:hypothetical protein
MRTGRSFPYLLNWVAPWQNVARNALHCGTEEEDGQNRKPDDEYLSDGLNAGV